MLGGYAYKKPQDLGTGFAVKDDRRKERCGSLSPERDSGRWRASQKRVSWEEHQWEDTECGSRQAGFR